jgi:chromosome segregation ATPase
MMGPQVPSDSISTVAALLDVFADAKTHKHRLEELAAAKDEAEAKLRELSAKEKEIAGAKATVEKDVRALADAKAQLEQDKAYIDSIRSGLNDEKKRAADEIQYQRQVFREQQAAESEKVAWNIRVLDAKKSEIDRAAAELNVKMAHAQNWENDTLKREKSIAEREKKLAAEQAAFAGQKKEFEEAKAVHEERKRAFEGVISQIKGDF